MILISALLVSRVLLGDHSTPPLNMKYDRRLKS